MATYAKRHLVPFGEFMPFHRQLRFISELKKIPRDFAPGTKPGLATVSGHRIATVICTAGGQRSACPHIERNSRPWLRSKAQ